MYRLPAEISTMVPVNQAVTLLPSPDGLKEPEKRRQGGPEQEGHAERHPGFHAPLLPRRHRQEHLGLERAEVPLLRARERSAQQSGGSAMKNREDFDGDAIRTRERLPDQGQARPTPQRRYH